ncbi:MAG TPA: hypothetical protein VLC09_13000, partial [Polyangiaceae bacterium]|nr:hypothetical protein [Polyangiaceae bacterium]
MKGNAKTERWWRKLGRRLLGATGLALVFVVSLPFAAVLHLDVPATRRAVTGILDGALAAALRGKISFANLARLDAFGVEVREIEVRDPSDRLVLRAERLVVDFDLFGVAQRFLRFFQKLSIEVDEVRIDGVEVNLYDTVERDKDGELESYPSIADAFSTRGTSQESSGGGRTVRIWFSDLALGRVFVSSRMTKLPPMQGSLDRAHGTLLITDKGVALDVAGFDLAASGLAGTELKTEGDFHLRTPGALWGKLSGTIGKVQLEEEYRVERGRVTLRGTMPELKPEAVRSIWPEWPLDRTISLEHEVSGVPPRLDAHAKLRAGSGEATVKGIVTVSPEIEADLDIDTENLDLSALRSNLPASRLTLRSAAEIWFTSGRPRLELNATLLPSQVLGNDIPPVDFVGTYDERGIQLDATLHERGLPLHLTLGVPDDGPLVYEFELRRTVLEESPRLTKLLGARGIVQGTVTGQLEGDRTVARTSIHGERLSLAGARIDALDLGGSAEVPLDDPLQAALSLRAQARGIRVGELVLTKAQVDANGPAARPHVALKADGQDGTHVEMTATTHTDGIEIDDAKASVTGRGKPILVRFDHLSFREGHLIARDFHLESEGRLDGDLDLTSQGGTVHVDASNLNIDRLAETAGLPRSTIAGRLTTRIDATLGYESKGSAEIHVSQGEYAGVRGIDFSLGADLNGHESSGRFDVELADVGHAEGEWKGTLAGHPFQAGSYTNATGTSSLTMDRFDLAMLSRFVPQQAVTVRGGNLTGHIALSRERAGVLPRAELTVDTSGLATELIRAAGPLRVDGVDVHVVGTIEPDSDQLQLVARADDFAGDLVSLAGSLRLPLGDWAERLPTSQELPDLLLDAPAELVLSFPRRRFDDYPPALGVPALS